MPTMAAPAAELTICDERDLRPIRRAVREIALSLPFDHKQVADITLAVSEACVNGVRYGTPETRPPYVVVKAEPCQDHLTIEVEDHGEGFANNGPRMPDVSAESGRGIALMHALMDQVNITSTRCGTCVRMIKYFHR